MVKTKKVPFILLLVSMLSVCSINTVAKPDSARESSPDYLTDSAQTSDTDYLTAIALRTWKSFEWMTHSKTGLPTDTITLDTNTNTYIPSVHTSPTNIATYIWSMIAAKDLGFITEKQMSERLEKLLTTVEKLERAEGFYLNWYDFSTGEPLIRFPDAKEDVRPFLSTVDNGWFVAGLMLLRGAVPEYVDRADALLKDMNLSFFYDKGVKQLYGGYHSDTKEYTGFHYGALNTEPRIVSYIGIANKTLPEEHYYKLWRTFPTDWTWQEIVPKGDWKSYTYNNKEYQTFQGVYVQPGNEDAPIVPSWGGSMFEALMVPLLVPESAWAPNSWKINHERYVAAQIRHGMIETGYGYWGFSPSKDPDPNKDYREYGVDWMGMSSEVLDSTGKPAQTDEGDGYYSDQEKTITDYRTNPPIIPSPSDYKSGVVTPHAVFLALETDFHATIDNLKKLQKNFDIYGPGGFYDAVDVKNNTVVYAHLALDQGMIMAAIANHLLDGKLRNYFSSQIESVRPLIAIEDFYSEITE